MHAIITGMYLKSGTYHSKKHDKDILQTFVLSGEQTIKIDNMPPEYMKSVNLGEEVEIPVRILNTDRGLYVTYNSGQ